MPNTTTKPEPEQRKRADRRRRTDLETTGGRLGVDPALLDHDRYAYRWFNDQPGRIVSKTKHDDWDMIPQNGEKEDSTDLGAMISIVVGTNPDGSPKRAYLCRKPKGYFEEDRAKAQRELDRQLDMLQRGKSRDGTSQSDYVPHSGIRVDEDA